MAGARRFLNRYLTADGVPARALTDRGTACMSRPAPGGGIRRPVAIEPDVLLARELTGVNTGTVADGLPDPGDAQTAVGDVARGNPS